MSKEKRCYTCPDDTTTTSLKRYLKSWKDIITPFEQNFDMVCTGFDPTITFRTKEKNWRSIQFPVDLVIKWNKIITDLKTPPVSDWEMVKAHIRDMD